MSMAPRTHGRIPLPPTAAHQNLASKLLCFCCWCEEAYDTDDKADAQIHTKHTSILPLITTEKRTSSSSSSYEGLQPPNELDKQKALLPSDKKISSSSSDYDDIYSHHSQGFYKRDLNRYRQERWPSQPCLIGKP
ncbi:testis-expressed protein 48 [Perognathus longimembris pacificus]|uniref:testis-expressed protein 48 n=1 Tax=Perognathus longimembris pacificus TaxID=214514 RepID=UPI002018B651|nr:testis-expressed protein 48 [Perognathus longimembris pacificus]